MNYITSPWPQGTHEWRKDRAGKATGSMASSIVAKIKTGEAAARRDYRIQLVTERLTGAPAEDGFINKEMQWGTDTEPFARMAYESATGQMVRESGFVYLQIMSAGCSVDGFIEGGGLLELKCPKSSTHIEYIQGGKLPSKYAPQVTHNLLVTGEPFADFASFDPRMPEGLQLFMVRVNRDDVDIEGYKKELMAFLAEVDELERDLRKRMRDPQDAELRKLEKAA